MSRCCAILAGYLTVCFGLIAEAQVTYTNTTWADAFLATGSPTNPDGADLTRINFGGAGALLVVSSANTNGEFQTLLKFNVADATNLFNTAYGTNAWAISALSLELAGNFSSNGESPNNPLFPIIHGGKFVIEWLANDDWIEGTGKPNLPTMDGVDFASLPDLLSQLHVPLCTNTFTPPGDNVHITYQLPLETNLVADILSGGDVAFRLYAADDQIAYLFNSYFFGRANQPVLHVTANPPPLQITAAFFMNRWFHLAGTGLRNTSYQIQTSPDLATTNWQFLATISSGPFGLIQFDDTNAPSPGSRFYRFVQ